MSARISRTTSLLATICLLTALLFSALGCEYDDDDNNVADTPDMSGDMNSGDTSDNNGASNNQTEDMEEDDAEDDTSDGSDMDADTPECDNVLCPTLSNGCEGNIAVSYNGEGQPGNNCQCDYSEVVTYTFCDPENSMCDPATGTCVEVTACGDVQCYAEGAACDPNDPTKIIRFRDRSCNADMACEGITSISACPENQRCTGNEPNAVCTDLCANTTCAGTIWSCDGNVLNTTAAETCDPTTGMCVPGTNPAPLDCAASGGTCDSTSETTGNCAPSN